MVLRGFFGNSGRVLLLHGINNSIPLDVRSRKCDKKLPFLQVVEDFAERLLP